jgi:hypothetical protein
MLITPKASLGIIRRGSKMRECAYKKEKPQTHAKTWRPFLLGKLVNCKTRFDNKKKRDPYNFIKFTNLEPGGLTLLHKLTNVKNVIHEDGRDNCGFYTIWWEHQQPTCDHHDN